MLSVVARGSAQQQFVYLAGSLNVERIVLAGVRGEDTVAAEQLGPGARCPAVGSAAGCRLLYPGTILTCYESLEKIGRQPAEYYSNVVLQTSRVSPCLHRKHEANNSRKRMRKTNKYKEVAKT